jgi:hypothetical protein
LYVHLLIRKFNQWFDLNHLFYCLNTEKIHEKCFEFILTLLWIYFIFVSFPKPIHLNASIVFWIIIGLHHGIFILQIPKFSDYGLYEHLLIYNLDIRFHDQCYKKISILHVYGKYTFDVFIVSKDFQYI